MNRPDTPFNRRLMHAALTSLRGRPSAEQIIDQHLHMTHDTFAPWAAEADAAFRARRKAVLA